MMYTTRSSHRKLWKYAAILPVFALMIAAQTTVLAQSKTTKESDSKVAPPPPPPAPPAPPKAPKAPPAKTEKAVSKEAPAVKEVPVTKEKSAPAVKDIKEEKIDGEITGPDEMPEYNGGQEAMMKYLASQLKYPDGVKASGTVFVSFLVKADGKVTNAQVKRGVAPELDKEALRVVSAMPNWKPAKKDGKPVDCEMVLPVRFAL